mmetsp:Transcript_16807/g.48827  ORF Transcript_16807/g.48827 Transcript_16807/m.48827 type:complete len:225 (+) Transcript_16807:323-997(+)
MQLLEARRRGDVEVLSDRLRNALAALGAFAAEAPCMHLRRHSVAPQHHPRENEAQLPDVVRDVVRHTVEHLGSLARCRATSDASHVVGGSARAACAAEIRQHRVHSAGNEDAVLSEVAEDEAVGVQISARAEEVDEQRQRDPERHRKVLQAAPLPLVFPDQSIQVFVARRLSQHMHHINGGVHRKNLGDDPRPAQRHGELDVAQPRGVRGPPDRERHLDVRRGC